MYAKEREYVCASEERSEKDVKMRGPKVTLHIFRSYENVPLSHVFYPFTEILYILYSFYDVGIHIHTEDNVQRKPISKHWHTNTLTSDVCASYVFLSIFCFTKHFV